MIPGVFHRPTALSVTLHGDWATEQRWLLGEGGCLGTGSLEGLSKETLRAGKKGALRMGSSEKAEQKPM